LWRAFVVQANKLANYFRAADPIAQMQYEYDLAVEQLQQGRQGLEQFRALVERVIRQVDTNRQQVGQLENNVKAYLAIGDRESAAKFALEHERVVQQLAENEQQLEMHEEAYAQNVARIKLAGKKLAEIRDKITRYDAELKMGRAESELAKLAADFHFDASTDFGQIEQLIQEKISLQRAGMRVASDLSGQPAIDLARQQALESALGEQALRKFEAQLAAPTNDKAPQLAGPSPQLLQPPRAP
jgi:phage shock protein A